MKKTTFIVCLFLSVFAALPLCAQNKGKVVRSLKNALGAETPRAAGQAASRRALFVMESQIDDARQLMLAAEKNRVFPPGPALAGSSASLTGLYERVSKSVAVPQLQKEHMRVEAFTNHLKDSLLRPYDELLAGRNLVFISGSAQMGAWNEVRELAASASRAGRPVVLALFHPFFSEGGTVPGDAFWARMALLGMKEWVQLSVTPGRGLWEQAAVWNRELGEKLVALRNGPEPVVIVFGPAAWMEGENGFKLAGLLKGKKFPSSKDVAIVSVQTEPAITRTAHNWDNLKLVKPSQIPYYSNESIWPARFRVDGRSALRLGSHAVVYTRASYSGGF